MTQLSVVFLWHMHQPYYRDMVQGWSMMPWVRLHAVKGYLDMAQAVSDCPGAKVTMNLTPCLVRQLLEEVDNGARDDFFTLSAKPTADLTPNERAFIVHFFFMADWETMVRPHDEYLRLLGKRGARNDADFEQLQKRFTEAEIRDLTVWFNLAWFGWYAEGKYPEIGELKRKRRGFSEADKKLVLDTQLKLEAEVLPFYRRLWDQGAIEVSTTPYFHPILPLIYDTVLADRCQPGVRLPPRFRHPEDARAQVEQGLGLMERALGRRPAGMWPSEGSVAPELVPIFLEAGVRWIGADEDNLLKRVRGLRRDEALFHPWKTGHEGKWLNLFFRDRGLSDLIGFNYSRQRAEVAAEDLVRRFREIRASLGRLNQDHGMVAVILDGENPWQAFPDGGRVFLHELYARILNTEGLEMCTASECLDRHPPTRELDQIGTGSWIRSNFSIWIGHPEENKAWDYLGRVRDDYARLAPAAPEPARTRALESIYAAEGSDWFWWYGDDFQSGMDCEFDYLFRMHLKNVYTLLGQEPPWFLNEPVIFDRPVPAAEEPTDFIGPVIDGKVSDYYEWRAAGRLDVTRSQGAMYQSSPRLKNIYYGFDLENFYLRLDPAPLKEGEPAPEVKVSFLGEVRKALLFTLSRPTTARVYAEGEGGPAPLCEIDTIAGGKIVELKVPFRLLGLEKRQEVVFRVELMDGDSELERYPRDGFIGFVVPDESFESGSWSA
jgi:alpha-amylase/alpha-mannosidase (GH57 family)